MLQTVSTHRRMVTARHHLAARAGLRVLEEGGNPVEATIAAASTVAVVYPHMNGLGGDAQRRNQDNVNCLIRDNLKELAGRKYRSSGRQRLRRAEKKVITTTVVVTN